MLSLGSMLMMEDRSHRFQKMWERMTGYPSIFENCEKVIDSIRQVGKQALNNLWRNDEIALPFYIKPRGRYELGDFKIMAPEARDRMWKKEQAHIEAKLFDTPRPYHVDTDVSSDDGLEDVRATLEPDWEGPSDYEWNHGYTLGSLKKIYRNKNSDSDE